MSDIKSEIVVTLSTPLKYSVGGEFKDANELILKAPSNNRRRQCNDLKQGFFRALKSGADSSGKVETPADASDHETTGDEIVTILMMSDTDFGAYMEKFREIVTNGACDVVDGVKLTPALFDVLELEDQDTLLGEYLANFLLASQLRKLKGK
jgi:hypothetical protein